LRRATDPEANAEWLAVGSQLMASDPAVDFDAVIKPLLTAYLQHPLGLICPVFVAYARKHDARVQIDGESR
jgi:hypothetical protein